MTKSVKVYVNVNASPVKAFFVSMFTRDIKLEEAILDLLDNCVDGVLRGRHSSSKLTPYKGFWAAIEFKRGHFEISDNCGGIPWKLHDYAFRMGRDPDRPSEPAGTVGVYGIGMKRAIFKMGQECIITTRSGADAYEVEISPEWMENEGEWTIPVRAAKRGPKDEDGTTILVGSLYPGIAARFSDDAAVFTAELTKLIATHYAFIIQKGFVVTINGRSVRPRPTLLAFTRRPARNAPAIRPFIYKTESQGVSVFMAVGFTRPIPSEAEIAAEQEDVKYSTIEAGWTILCNDRAVVYCDRTELTGWGEANVPRYHTQFIAISGIVEFRAADASKLPTMTTKRGIDASSPLFLQVKNKMREGMRLFIDYTNRWKTFPAEARRHLDETVTLSFEELKAEAVTLPMIRVTRLTPSGKQYTPHLPLPQREGANMRRIQFTRPRQDVERVAEHLFDDKGVEPSLVGEKCFDLALRDARR